MSNFNFKQEAIRKLYNNAVTIYENEDGSCRVLDNDQNEVSIDMTAVNTKATELENAKVDLKASAKAKLIAGEALTEEEADTIVVL
jgi:hypothetical protein|tara:strand:- start:816 stop:1073 length:258 start_codon:yes stop_codon:yes gene_type:complete